MGQADRKTKKTVGKKNSLDNYGGKEWLVCNFIGQEFWKCSGCILSSVTYGKNGHNRCEETKIYVGKKARTKLLRDVCGKIDLNKIHCDIYLPRYSYDFN